MLLTCPGTKPDGSPCRNPLATVDDGATWVIRHRGRRYWTRGIDAVECEDCGQITPADRLVPRPSALVA